MLHLKKDFPILGNNPGLIFFDSGASAQKPSYVIDGVSQFVSNNYANIHRGQYGLSERADDLYHRSKEKVAEHLNCKANELFYSYNATYCSNLIAHSLAASDFFQEGDKILVGIWEHHANIVPWQIVAKRLWLEIGFIECKEDYSIDWDDFDKKYDDKVKLVALGHVSNVTGQIYDIQKLWSLLREDTFFFVDGSQSVPHFSVDMEEIWCDAFVFTGHKMMSYTGIGVAFLKRDWIKKLEPVFSGGGAIKEVTRAWCTFPNNYEKFEPGTPHIIGAVSLLKAFEYIENIGAYEAIEAHEQTLVDYAVDKFAEIQDNVKLLWSYSKKNRAAIFSFYLPKQMNFNLVGEHFAEHNICIRCGGHCAYPLHRDQDIPGTNRASLYIYNTMEEMEKFFEVLGQF